jgi:hypothetical protein
MLWLCMYFCFSCCGVYSRFTKHLFVIILQTLFILCMGERQGNTCYVEMFEHFHRHHGQVIGAES